VVGALGKHLALIGFMGAGKSTIGREVAERTARPFIDTDEEIEKEYAPIPELFEKAGEKYFRAIEESVVPYLLRRDDPTVFALGGGAVLSEAVRDELKRRAFTVWIAVEPAVAWQRVERSGRPLARTRRSFERLYQKRQPIYEEVSDAVAGDADGVLLAALNVAVHGGIRTSRASVVIADEAVWSLHPFELDVPVHRVPAGEAAKTLDVVQRLWTAINLGREGEIIALGGGSTTDVAGFVAATYLRGIRWHAVPTTLTGMVDAAIGGKTGINTDEGKNLAGVFHFPATVSIQPDYLSTLPEEERRAGMAEVVKTGLLAGREVWSLPEQEMIRACAAFKAGVVLSDPYEREGRRTTLNLGHTFAHALEAGSGYRVRHGEAVALGLLAALRLSGEPTGVVEELLQPEPVEADPEAAWAALKRDKKGEGVFVLLDAPGRPVVTTVPDRDARDALDALIRK
jgi:shikimate kinase / 3-dehydroquinate synthase